MNKSTSFQLNRREFVATTGAVGAVILLPITLPAARTASGAAIAGGTTPGLQPFVYCEFETVSGVLRSSAWQHSNGTRLEIERTTNGAVAGFRLGNTVSADEYFLREELQFGRAQEIIRHKFGENVLCHVIEAVDNHYG